MRKVLISLAAAAATMAVAAPASAQNWGNMTPGYGAPAYGYNAYGYNNGYRYNSVSLMQRQLQQIRVQADQLGRSGRLTRAEARDLYRDLNSAERSLYRSGRNGFSQWEARSLQDKITRIQYEVHQYADYDGRRGYNRGYGYGDRDWDRDRRDRD